MQNRKDIIDTLCLGLEILLTNTCTQMIDKAYVPSVIHYVKHFMFLCCLVLVDKCSLKIPISTSRNKQGCGNLVQRWVYDASTKNCEHFLFSPCDGEDLYYQSQWECRSKCIGKFRRQLPQLRAILLKKRER
jgi:hypothetical protein